MLHLPYSIVHSNVTTQTCVLRMKVTLPSKRGKKKAAGFVPPSILFERPAIKDLGKDNYVALKLKTVPRSASSAEYSLNVP